MANDITTNPRLWILDTAGALKAAGNRVFVRGLHFEPAAVDNIVALSEYGPDGSTRQLVARRRADHAAAEPVDASFDPPLECNGLYLETLTAGSVWVEVDKVSAKL
jgi:hypothetical protein